jgi:bifunctional UDP-N-acetylglucosamine pyrophosphorylase/glucosamine-1-phosphate N-acetyltransferase
VGLAVSEGHIVQGIAVADATATFGINTRVHLSHAENIVRERIREALMLSGVTLLDPDSTYVETGVTVGRDTTIYPNTHLQGRTHIGEECHIGPNSIIRDSTIGHRCRLLASVVEEAQLEDDVSVGPFAHLRKDAYLASGIHMGNFGEIKNSRLGPGTKMGHFSYVGDAQIAADVNIGAGTITCNFDGAQKQTTIIEEGAFIGSDTMLVAPVRIGKRARTGAGSVVTRDVPPGSVVYGFPARPKKTAGQ